MSWYSRERKLLKMTIKISYPKPTSPVQSSTIWLFHWQLYRIMVMVFNATFNNISFISWQSVLLVEKTGWPRENHWPSFHTNPLCPKPGTSENYERIWLNKFVFCSKFGFQAIGWKKLRQISDLPQVTDKLYHIIKYTSPRAEFKLATLVVIGTDCTGSCESNHHMITTLKVQQLNKLFKRSTCIIFRSF